MFVIIGAIIVIASVLGGFIMADGHPVHLVQISEYVVICGAAFGAMVTMAPKKVLVDLFKQIIGALKGAPFNKKAYEELFKALYELFKTSDAMPGFGIVAAVLGIVITMGSIAGPIEEIGHHVAAALVGTFLGILISYGFLAPLAVNMEFNGASEMSYVKCIASSVIGFANGMAPVMAVEVVRRGLSSDVKPSAEEMETMLKGVGK